MSTKYLFLFLFCFSVNSLAQVWTPQNSWSSQSEIEFAQFIENEFGTDFFTNSNSLGYNIPTDCADALYAARIAFAWKNSLPVQFRHPQGGWITQRLTQWNHLPERERVKAFMRYVGELSNTWTLQEDTYPVKISRETLLPGSIYLSPSLTEPEKAATNQSGGHAEIIKSIDETGYVRLYGSTTPKLVRTLTSNRNPVHAPVVTRGGFRRFKQPHHHQLPNNQLPDYSMQQFQVGDWQPLSILSRKKIYLWNEAIRSLLRTKHPTFEDRVDVVVESICEIYKSRIDIVKSAWSHIQARGQICLSGSSYDDYSTPKKDARIKDAYRQLDDMYKWRKLEGGFHNIKDAKALLEKCVIEYWPGYSANTWELFLRMIDGRIVSDPNYSPAVRWGHREKPLSPQCR